MTDAGDDFVGCVEPLDRAFQDDVIVEIGAGTVSTARHDGIHVGEVDRVQRGRVGEFAEGYMIMLSEEEAKVGCEESGRGGM